MMYWLHPSFVWLLVFSSLVTSTSASGLDDFSNDLATDVGPLLALFGEKITIQYFSESTSFLDYFIFAMAPMGIVTSMTSAIRVCGDSSLQAFIGRAQEGEGTVEAELCTSTSRDVCELFHRGGITRVFGKPKTLEIVYIRGAGEDSKMVNGRHVMGTYLFRDYLRQEENNPTAAWAPKKINKLFPMAIAKRLFWSCRPKRPDVEHANKRKTTKVAGQKTLQKTSMATTSALESPDMHQPSNELQSRKASETPSEMLVQNPNISINIGIIRLPGWLFWIVALAGFCLQSGVIAMAVVMSWKLQWTEDGAPKGRVDISAAVSKNQSPMPFIIGTVCLGFGMLACAALIGESTVERRYQRRTGGTEPKSSQLFWVQPGNQEVGDETFDAFAYVEDTGKKRLLEYTTSSKRRVDHLHPYTWIAVILVLGGYIAQFIGLRGMNASVSMAQLGVTLFMSLLRSCLRMRRLKRTDNRLATIPDMVLGHELDWLAFEIKNSKTSTSDDANLEVAPAEGDVYGWIMTGHPDLGRHRSKNEGQQENDDAVQNRKAKETLEVSVAERLLRYRTRLADLTGHQPSTPLKNQSIQRWSNEQVHVRAMAIKLASALCGAAKTLLGGGDGQDAIPLGLQAVVWKRQLEQQSTKTARIRPAFASFRPGRRRTLESGIIEVVIQPPNEASPSSWSIDSARLEGILGLWLWSLKQANISQQEDKHKDKYSLTEEVLMALIVLSSENTQVLEDTNDFDVMENELDLWLGQDVIKPLRGTLHYPPGPDIEEVLNPSSLWASRTGEEWYWYPAEYGPRGFQGKRFFGWQAIAPSAEKDKANKTSDRINVLYTNSRNNLLTECCQDLYSTLLVSLVSKANCRFDGVTVSGTIDQIRLEDPKISALITAFMESGLGSRFDAILCIVPGLRKHIRLKKSDLLESSLLQVLGQGDLEKNKAEALLEWIYLHSKASEEVTGITMDQELFANSLIAVGEFYRKTFADNQTAEARHSGYQKLQRIIKKYRGDAGHGSGKVGEVLDRYGMVAMQRAIDHKEDDLLKGLTCNGLSEVPNPADLIRAVEGKKRTETLYLLCVMPPQLLITELETALPLAARNQWDEVTRALLDLGAFVDGQNENGRTALSYYCERRGSVSMVKALLDSGAHPDLPDEHKRTPLWWAAKVGDREMIKTLRDTRKVLLDSVDDQGRSPLSQAAENNHREVLRMLRDSGLVKLDLADNSGRTPLSYAAGNGNVTIVKDLVNDRRVDADSSDNDGRTPFSWAAGNGHVKVLRIVAAMRTVDLNSRDIRNMTPLAWAAENSHARTVKELRNNGRVDPNARDIYGLSPLVRAARAGLVTIVEALLDGNIDDSRVDIYIIDDMGRTALWWALRSGELTASKILLDHATFDLDLRDETGRTPLWWAARNGHEHIVRFLVEKGANPAARDSSGQTPVWWAARNGHTAIVQILLATERAEPDARGNLGHTPLMWSIRRGNLDIAKMLLETGKVDLAARDDEGRSVLSWAFGTGHSHLLEVLGVSTKEDWADKADFRGQRYPSA